MKKSYKVWLEGKSLTAFYPNIAVDVFAEDERDAEITAKRVLTSSGGTFSDWAPFMFTATKIEIN